MIGSLLRSIRRMSLALGSYLYVSSYRPRSCSQKSLNRRKYLQQPVLTQIGPLKLATFVDHTDAPVD